MLCKYLLQYDSVIEIGCVVQHVLQVFIAQPSNVFMTWVPSGSAVCLAEQVDICKRVLNIY